MSTNKDKPESNLPRATISQLLDAGVHFGHKTHRWNPKMSNYIYGQKDGIHIIDVRKTLPLLDYALKAMYSVVKNNGKILFVGTKIQVSDLIPEYIEKCGQYYVNHRWLGGTMTNWGTISKSIKELERLEQLLENQEQVQSFTKKEIQSFERKRNSMLRSLKGIRELKGNPDMIVVMDTYKERIAIREAAKLNIPVVAIVDSNSNTDNISYPIPGNDDAIKSIRLYLSLFVDTILLGIQEALKQSGVDMGNSESVSNSKSNLNKIHKTKRNSSMKLSEKPQHDDRQLEEMISKSNT